MKGGEFRFNRIEPRGLGRQVDRFHVMVREERLGRTDIRGQIIHHHIDANLDGIARPELGETGLDVVRRLALTDASDQAIGMHVIEAMQLFDAVLASVRGAMALWLALRRPTHS